MPSKPNVEVIDDIEQSIQHLCIAFCWADFVMGVQVRGLQAIKQFSQTLMKPYQPAGEKRSERVLQLEAEVAQLKARIADLEQTAAGH